MTRRAHVSLVIIVLLMVTSAVKGFVIWRVHPEPIGERASTMTDRSGGKEQTPNNDSGSPVHGATIPITIVAPQRFPAFFLSLDISTRRMYAAPDSPVLLPAGAEGGYPRWTGTVHVLDVRDDGGRDNGSRATVSVRYQILDEDGQTKSLNTEWELEFVRPPDMPGTWMLYDITPSGQPLPLW